MGRSHREPRETKGIELEKLVETIDPKKDERDGLNNEERAAEEFSVAVDTVNFPPLPMFDDNGVAPPLPRFHDGKSIVNDERIFQGLVGIKLPVVAARHVNTDIAV